MSQFNSPGRYLLNINLAHVTHTHRPTHRALHLTFNFSSLCFSFSSLCFNFSSLCFERWTVTYLVLPLDYSLLRTWCVQRIYNCYHMESHQYQLTRLCVCVCVCCVHLLIDHAWLFIACSMNKQERPRYIIWRSGVRNDTKLWTYVGAKKLMFSPTQHDLCSHNYTRDIDGNFLFWSTHVLAEYGKLWPSTRQDAFPWSTGYTIISCWVTGATTCIQGKHICNKLLPVCVLLLCRNHS